ncbi:hypothetical protein C2W62_43220, partial [Candidatus Entotheonella serta]
MVILRCGVCRDTPFVDKAKAMRFFDNQPVDVLDARLSQCHIGSGDVGMIANLGLGLLVTPDKDAGHHVLRHVGFHLSRVEALDEHQ